MGKIMIIEDKADKIVDKLEMMKDCVEEMIDCFAEAMEGHRYPEEDNEWDDEYEVKRRRDSRYGSSRDMRRGMRGTGGYGGGTSRY